MTTQIRIKQANGRHPPGHCWFDDYVGETFNVLQYVPGQPENIYVVDVRHLSMITNIGIVPEDCAEIVE